MRKLVLSSKDIESKSSAGIDKVAYIQMLYKQVVSGDTVDKIARKILNNTDANKHYVLVNNSKNNIRNLENAYKAIDITEDFYRIIDLDTMQEVNTGVNNLKKIKLKKCISKPEQVVYINDRLVITFQVVSKASMYDSEGTAKIIDDFCNELGYQTVKSIYTFRYRMYINTVENGLILVSQGYNSDNEIDKLTVQAEHTFKDTYSSLVKSVHSYYNYIRSDDIIDSDINKLFLHAVTLTDMESVNVNILNGHSLVDLFTFINPETKEILKDRVIVCEKTELCRYKTASRNTSKLLELGLSIPGIDKNDIQQDEDQARNDNVEYAEIRKKISDSDDTGIKYEITYYKDLDELSSSLQMKDKQTLISRFNARYTHEKREVCGFDCSVILDEYGNETIMCEDGTVERQVSKQQKYGQLYGMTYRQLKHSNILNGIHADSNLMIRNIQTLFEGIDNVDSMGNIQSLYENIMSIRELLSNFVSSEDLEDYDSIIEKYKYCIYTGLEAGYNQKVVFDLGDINSQKYLTDHEMNMTDRVKFTGVCSDKQMIGDQLILSKYAVDMNKLKQTRLKIKLYKTIDIEILKKALEPGYKHQDRGDFSQSSFDRRNMFGGLQNDGFFDDNKPQPEVVKIENIVLPDDIRGVLDGLEYKYQEIKIS